MGRANCLGHKIRPYPKGCAQQVARPALFALHVICRDRSAGPGESPPPDIYARAADKHVTRICSVFFLILPKHFPTHCG